MVTENQLQKYAALAVRSGVNIQKGQLLVIRASVDVAYFARLCVKEAYEAGAKRVVLLWTDEQIEKIAFEHEDTQSMEEIFSWEVQQRKDFVERGYAFLSILSSTPGLMKNIPSEKLLKARLARQKALEPFDEYFDANHGQWSIVAVPTQAWAKKVFPEKPEQEALDALWNAVLTSVRITEDNDPVKEWQIHDETLKCHCDILNALNLRSLHFKNSKGTDLTVPLVANHVWVGGGSSALDNGAFFNPNIPTEEVFCMPHKDGAQGTVYATKPLNYQGKLIHDFWLRFENGKVVDYGAKDGEDNLKALVEFDEGSCRLGEVALIPHESPISNLGILFFETLFDENASCHLALGDSYQENLSGGVDMSREELTKHGANHSKEHCDFMFGSADMNITGMTQEGKEVPVFKQGNFVFDE